MIRVNRQVDEDFVAELSCGCMVGFMIQPGGISVFGQPFGPQPAAVTIERRCKIMQGLDLDRDELAWFYHIEEKGVIG
jgi:hypothetical protein